MLDHIGIRCADFGRSLAFFQQALAPLGITVVMQVSAAQTGEHDHAGFGRSGKPDVWISDAPGAHGGVHLAFSATRRADVDAFHRAALAAGGTDNGAPGIREHYHPDYYGAFVLDPDGNNIEAVCHHPG